MTDEPVGLGVIARLLGKTGNQVYMWHQRRAKNGFPEAVASVHIPHYPGDKRKAPLFDLAEVTEWWATYDPKARSGKHFQEKRGEGVPPRTRRKDIQDAWRARQARNA